MKSTFPRIEFSSEDGKKIAKLAISEGSFAVWHLSKKALLQEITQKLQERRITYYQGFVLGQELLSDKDFDNSYMEEDTDEDIRAIFQGLSDAENEDLLDFMKAVGNPYSEELAARFQPPQFWASQDQAEVFFSGPNFSSRSFSNRQAAKAVIGELLEEKSITGIEASYLTMIVKSLNLPDKAPARRDNN